MQDGKDDAAPAMTPASSTASGGRPQVAAHAALPWSVMRAGLMADAKNIFLKIESPWIEDAWEGNDEAAANAALIVKAVNCHDDLLEALKAFRALYLEAKCPTAEYITRTLQAVNFAIDKAELGSTQAGVRAMARAALKSAGD